MEILQQPLGLLIQPGKDREDFLKEMMSQMSFKEKVGIVWPLNWGRVLRRGIVRKRRTFGKGFSIGKGMVFARN